MKPSASKVATAAPSSSTTVKYELLSFRSTQPQQPVRFEFGHLKETFTLDLPVDPNDGTTKQHSWREWKRRAIEHATVRQYFKPSATLHFGEFALRLPGSAGDWIGPDSLRDDEEADTKLLLRIAGANNTNASILLLYAPSIHICTFDGIKFAACSFGHWLSASDTKTLERVKRATGEESLNPNDFLLKEDHQADLARLLLRVALFMQEELKLESDAYVISVPFGQYIFADGDGIGRDEVRARVQLTDTRIFWTLLLKFEEKLLDDERSKRLDYFVHQRQAWVDARSTDYKRWANQEAASVRVALEAPTPPPTTQFKLPRNCSWDEYGRMQLCLKMLSPLWEMVGHMGAISTKLKTVVAAIQMAATLTGTSVPRAPVSINVSTRGDQCLVLLPADRYMSVLTRASADPKTWGAALLDALRDAPDRLYSGLLYETSGLYQCSRDDLAKLEECLKSLAPKVPGFKGLAKVVDMSSMPMSADVIRSLETKNHTDKRLFYERAMEQKAFSGGVVLSVLGPVSSERQATAMPQPTVWEKKRASAAPPVLNAVPLRDPLASLSATDRDDAHHGEDFVRFEGDQARSVIASDPTPAQARSAQGPSASATSRAGPGARSQMSGSEKSPVTQIAGERPPPPTVFEKPLPPQVKRGPPRVLDMTEPSESAPSMSIPKVIERPPPPQVKPGPPTVMGFKSAPTAVSATAAVDEPLQTTIPPSAGQKPRSAERRHLGGTSEWRGPQDAPSGYDSNRKEQVTIRGPDSQLLDREDRGFEAMNGPPNGSFRGGRGNYRGRGRGRGGFNGNRGGRGHSGEYGNNSANSESLEAMQ